MPEDIYDAVREKVRAIFSGLVGDRERNIRQSVHGGPVHKAIAAGLCSDMPRAADEIAFHMIDWSDDAGFIVALHLFPERFTPDEIEAGIGLFLAHVPAHVIAAARLMGYPTDDIFAEG